MSEISKKLKMKKRKTGKEGKSNKKIVFQP